MLKKYWPEACSALVILSVSSILAVVFQPSFAGTDLAQTISVTRNLIDGFGLSTDLLYYEIHYKLGTAPVPQTVFPPGYSILLGPPALVGLNLIDSAFVLSLISWGIVAALLGGSVMLLTGERLLASIAAVVWSLLTVNWAIILEARSEALYTALATASIYFVAKLESGDRRLAVPLLLSASAAAGAAFLVRYQGVFLIAAMGLVYAGRFLRKPRAVTALVDFGAVASFTLLPVVLIFGRNYLLTGHFGGGPIASVADGSGTGRVLVAVYHELSRITGFSVSGLKAGGIAEILLLVALVIGFASLFRNIPDIRSGMRKLKNPVVQICIAYIGITVVVLGYLGVTKSINYVQSRYLATLLPPIILLGCVFLRGSSDLKRTTGWSGRIGYAILALAFLTGQYNAGAAQLKLATQGWGYSEIEHALATDVGGQSLRKLLAEAIDSGDHLLADRSQITGPILDKAVHGLPPAGMSDRTFGEHEVLELAAMHNIKYLLIYPELYDISAPRNKNRLIFSEVMSSGPPQWTLPVLMTDEVWLFRIIQIPSTAT